MIKIYGSRNGNIGSLDTSLLNHQQNYKTEI